ncbi:hypothetical protein K470DRAFT_298217 [Piedraia hortae CBS 480.64]|uniref:tRNA/rRNA methyltransferase SpoU type domain-containing protein n=1 Tax=Piedraia hortae CBS 480.64 TaxID=1314780 RepID=A0A6A7C6W6_9PEZI|nr:hypothetical protein K470DRAFT_298217 [Piedraia hortae CBS 480.64]
MIGPLIQALLEGLPENDRATFIHSALNAAAFDNVSEISIALDLGTLHSDKSTEKLLIENIADSVSKGHVDDILSTVDERDSFRHKLLQCIVERLCSLTGALAAPLNENVVLSFPDVILPAYTDGNPNQFTDQVQLSATSFLNIIDRLFESSLILAAVKQEDVCVGAQHTLSLMISRGLDISERNQDLFRKAILMLSTVDSPTHRRIGDDLWLQMALSNPAILGPCIDSDYWKILIKGLRVGDDEQRKKCLGIIRPSVAIAASSEELRPSICSKTNAALPVIIEHYERYCTVFETILLGRYLNQVIECEPELTMLSFSSSAIRPEWLYAVLSAVLACATQNSTRKFIGNWIMSSNFQPEASDDFVAFLEQSFLPWVTQGALFTSTLKPSDDAWRCEHGDRLVGYVLQLLCANAGTDIGNALVTAVLSAIIGKRTGQFAYAGVYLLEGVGRAFDESNGTVVTAEHMETIAQLAAWSELPEVARDYVTVRCTKMCWDYTSRNGPCDSTARVSSDWQTVQSRILNGKAAGPISSWISQSSKRDRKEIETLEKIDCFLANASDGGTVSAPEANAFLEDIWTDLEYLEWPKKVLIRYPEVLFHSSIAKLLQPSEELCTTVTNKLHVLQQLAENRTYLLPPVMLKMRKIIPEAAQTLSISGFVLRQTEQLFAPTVETRIEVATISLLINVHPLLSPFGYEYYFGQPPSAGVAALLDIVSRLGPKHAKDVLDNLLPRWVMQKTPPLTISPWKSSLQLQIMLLCCEEVCPELDEPQTVKMLNDLHYVLSIEPLPRYRYLLNWMIARIYLHRPHLRSKILQDLSTKDHHSNPKYLASLMKIAAMLATAVTGDEEFANQISTSFVPLAASSKVVIRHEAQWQFPILIDHAKAQGWTSITQSPAFLVLDEYIRSLARYDDPPIERKLDVLDPVKDHTLSNLVAGPWFGLDHVERPLCSRDDFVSLHSEHLPKSCIPLGEPLPPPPIATQESSPPTQDQDQDQDLVPSTYTSTRALQTKGTAYLAQTPRPRRSVILIASFISSPSNLGGLSRAGEIFGISELHVQNQNITTSSDFRSVAVSSHLHLPIHQLSAANVAGFLAEKRDEGWRVVGIEQTDRSHILGREGEYIIPEKVVLVLGSEKGGIPAHVLGECEDLIEIPQVGVTRSLNVQTAASIVLYEYARWHGS